MGAYSAEYSVPLEQFSHSHSTPLLLLAQFNKHQSHLTVNQIAQQIRRTASMNFNIATNNNRRRETKGAAGNGDWEIRNWLKWRRIMKYSHLWKSVRKCPIEINKNTSISDANQRTKKWRAQDSDAGRFWQPHAPGFTVLSIRPRIA